MLNLFTPILFISYSREDQTFVENLTRSIRGRGFRIFLDTSNIDPGDNFVATLLKELRRSTAVVPVITENYSQSRWAQAELYQALTNNKMVIPILVGDGSISNLDDPLQRLLRDIQYVVFSGKQSEDVTFYTLMERLSDARKRYKIELFKKFLPYLLGILVLMGSVWWAIENLNYIKQAQSRNAVISKVQQSSEVLQQERVAQFASEIAGDNIARGELFFLSQDPSQSDVARFNSLALGSKLRAGQEEYRWYVNDLSLSRSELKDTHFVKTTFLDGDWDDVEFIDSVFANVVWSQENGFTMSGVKFKNTLFVGSEINDVSVIVANFENSKFIGSRVDTTNFAKVRFFTTSPETEGNPIITPYYTLFDKSVLISDRPPPEEGVLDLTMTGDDVVFDDVLFIDTRFEGWFQAEWFRNSTFQNCEFTKSLSRTSLENAGNIVQ